MVALLQMLHCWKLVHHDAWLHDAHGRWNGAKRRITCYVGAWLHVYA